MCLICVSYCCFLNDGLCHVSCFFTFLKTSSYMRKFWLKWMYNFIVFIDKEAFNLCISMFMFSFCNLIQTAWVEDSSDWVSVSVLDWFNLALFVFGWSTLSDVVVLLLCSADSWWEWYRFVFRYGIYIPNGN